MCNAKDILAAISVDLNALYTATMDTLRRGTLEIISRHVGTTVELPKQHELFERIEQAPLPASIPVPVDDEPMTPSRLRERVVQIVGKTHPKTKGEILAVLGPGMLPAVLQKTLTVLCNDGILVKSGNTRSTAYLVV